jgi:glycosyltransferase involved in cell wall biosynthesis
MNLSSVVSPVYAGRVALLTNVLLPDRKALLSRFATHVRELRIFVSAMAETRDARPSGGDGLNVKVQQSLRLRYRFRHVNGYKDESEVQIPVFLFTELFRYSPDVILTGEFGARTLMAVIYGKLRPKTRMILWATLSQRTEATRGKLRTLVRRWILKRVHAAFVNGKDGEMYLRSLKYAGPVYVIPYVIDAAEFEGPSTVENDGRTHIFYAGQLNERKGIYPFFASLCDWCRAHPGRRIFFRVAGSGQELDRLQSVTLPSNLEVQFVGFLDRARLAEAYRAASFYVFPTFGDEWGLVVNEALTSGLPVLGSCHSLAATYLIQDGVNGWLFDPSTPGGLREGMDRALSVSREELLAMSANAKAGMAQWTPSIIAEKMAQAVREVFEAGTASPDSRAA